jgi:hypothetical protein
VTSVLILFCFFIQVDIKILNFNVNEVNLPPELPPPNDWMVELNATQPETRNTFFTLRLYVSIKRDGKFGAMG